MLAQQRFPYYSLGYWIEEMQKGKMVTYSKGNLLNCLEKYIPLILENFPLPLALAVPTLHPKTHLECTCIIHGGDFFEALYRFYKSELHVCPNDFHWIGESAQSLPHRLTWNNAPDSVQEAIFYTGIYVVELLSSENEYFTCAQIEEISKINFSF